MRLPYLQLEVEIIEQLAPDLATELGIEEAEAGWGVPTTHALLFAGLELKP
jgi:hypothetical protein